MSDNAAAAIVGVHVLETLEGPAFAVQRRLAFVEAHEARPNDPAFALALLLRFAHLDPGISQPELRDVVDVLDGLIAIGVLRELLEEIAVDIGRLRVIALQTQTFGPVIQGFLNDGGRVLLVVGDVVVKLLALVVVFAAEELARAGKFGFGALVLGRLFGDQGAVAQHETLDRRRRRRGRLEQIELVPGTAAHQCRLQNAECRMKEKTD